MGLLLSMGQFLWMATVVKWEKKTGIVAQYFVGYVYDFIALVGLLMNK